MYQRRPTGYIEQQIEAMALVLATILGLKANREFPAAQVEIGKAFQNLAGVNLATILALPESMALTFFRSANDVDAGRALVAAMLLEQNAAVADDMGLAGSSRASLARALTLYVESVAAEETLRTPEYEVRINRILTVLGDDALAAITRKRLGMPF